MLLFSSTAGFVPLDIVWPLHSPKQTLYNCFGGLAFYSILFVVLTSYFRSKLGSRLWKKLHFVSYATALFVFVHGVLIDPNLKGHPPDYLDGEKVLVEVCALLIVAATILRVRYQETGADCFHQQDRLRSGLARSNPKQLLQPESRVLRRIAPL